jgi:hypothetical protein
VYGLATGGGGCACRTSPSSGHDYRAFSLVAGALGLMGLRRRRQRRAA